MAVIIPTNAVEIARFANGLFGLQLGFATSNQVANDVSAYGGLNAAFNNYYTLAYGSATTASVAAAMTANLGITAANGVASADITNATAYITAQLNAAPASARGAVVKSVLDIWSNIASDPVNGAKYGTAATAWNTTISAAVTYAGAINPDIIVSAAAAANAAAAAAGIVQALTTNVDTFSANTFNAILSTTAGVSTLTTLDSLTGAGTNNTLNITDLTGGSTVPSVFTLSNVQNVNYISAGTVGTLDLTQTGISGVTNLTVSQIGGDTSIIGSTAAVTVNDAKLAAATVTVDGGSGITITANGVTTGSIAAGQTTALKGAVTATSSGAETAATPMGTIQVKGGTSIVVTENETAAAATAASLASSGTAFDVTGGAITVTGTTDTTSVTVNQSNTATKKSYAAGTSAVGYASAVTAAPGTTGVAANAGTDYAAASAYKQGVVNGAVTINDVNSAIATTLGTITTVSLNGFGTASAINANALKTLNLSGTAIAGTTLTITDNLTAHSIANGGTTLALNTNTFSSTSYISDATVSTLNLTNTGTSAIGGTQAAATATSAALATGATKTTNLSTAAGKLGATVTAAADMTAVKALTLTAAQSGLITLAQKVAIDAAANPTAAAAVIVAATTGAYTIANAAAAADSSTGTLKTADTLAGTTIIGKGFVDAGLTTINLSGSGSITLPLNATNDAALAALNISGSVGYSDGGDGSATTYTLASFGSALTITDTSTGAFTATLDDTTQSLNASSATGVVTVYLAGDATKTITAGSGTTDELVLTATGAGSYTLAKTGTKVTGFEVLGIRGSVNNGTIDLANFSTGFNALDVISTGTVTVNNLAQNSPITFQANTSLTVNYADASGATDSVKVTIGSTTNSTAKTIGTLALADANANGIGTLSIVSNNTTQSSGYNQLGANVITTLTDANLATLNISGTGGLTITNALTTNAGALTINNTSTNTSYNSAVSAAPASLTFDTGITDNGLGSITFAGTGSTSIETLSDTTSASLTLTNSGTGNVTIGTFTDDALKTLNISGNVAIPTLKTAVTTGIRINAATDNSAINLDTINIAGNANGGAAATYTDNITLGNGNNTVKDRSVDGTVNITVGTGSNLIDVSAGNQSATYQANITLGAHTVGTGIDKILVGCVRTAASAPNVIVTGATAGDQLYIADGTTVTTLTSTVLNAVASQASLSAAVAYVDGAAATGTALAIHNAVAFVWGGNTYVLESAGTGSGTLTNSDTLIELVGSHTLSSTVSTNVFTLAS